MSIRTRNEKETRARTYLVQDEHELLSLAFPSPDLPFDESTSAPLWIARVGHEDDDVALVDDLVERADVVSLHLFFGFLSGRYGARARTTLARMPSSRPGPSVRVATHAIQKSASHIGILA